MNNPTIDAGIPVLTEVIPAPQPPSAPQQKETAAPPEPEPAAKEDVLRKPAAPEWDDEHWERLEREVRERILQQVLERIDLVLEQRVRDSLADVLQLAVEGLAEEIKGGLHHTIKDVVSRAVSQEIMRLQTTKK